MGLIDRVSQLLSDCDKDDGVLPPTILYNEGWLLRLVLDWYSRNRSPDCLVPFASGAGWSSEVLLPSRFFKHTSPEGWTHADAVVGHFAVRRPRGDAALKPDAEQFIVIEAKMGSPLSAGTKHAPTFNQAARNIACMLHMLARAQRPAGSLHDLGFLVFAPHQRIAQGHFKAALQPQEVMDSIRQRGDETEEHLGWCGDYVYREVPRMRIGVLAWEQLLDDIRMRDQTYAETLRVFYENCCRFNGLGSPAP